VISLAHPSLGPAELDAIRAVLDSGQLVSGRWVEELEARVAQLTRCAHAVAVSSGTAALHLALLALDIGPGDEVIVPDFTFPATANVVRIVGATPVLVDIDLATFNLDPTQLDGACAPRTRAIIPVHLFGLPCDMTAVLRVAGEFGLSVIEDAACALGASFDGRPCGSIGTVGCFSYHPRKIVTSGEGGVVVTDDRHLAAEVRTLRNHGFSQSDGSESVLSRPGLNYRMSDIHAALGTIQTQQLGDFLARRREIATWYFDALGDCPGIRLPQRSAQHTYQSFVVLLDPSLDRRRVMENLAVRGIQTTIGTYAVSLQPAYADAGASNHNSRVAARQAMSLPLHIQLTQNDIDQVASALREVVSREIG
jgi:perosamine synthetase